MALRARKALTASALAIAIVLAAYAVMLLVRMPSAAVDGAKDNKYGLFLASYRADMMNDIFSLKEIYPGAVSQVEDDFLGKSFVIGVMRNDRDSLVKEAEDYVGQRLGGVAPVIYLAYDAFLSGDYGGAVKRVDSGAAGKPGPLLKLVKSWMLAAAGRPGEGAALLETERGNRTFRKIFLMHMAALSDLDGRAELAAELYDEALGHGPDLFDVENIAGFYIRRGNREKALEIVSGFVGGMPLSVSATEFRDMFERGAYEPVSIDGPAKGFSKALFDIAGMLLRAAPFANDMSMMYLDMAIAVRPDFDMARLVRAEIYKKHGRTDEYAAAVNGVGKGSYLYLIARMNYASYLFNRGERKREALRLYRELMASHPRVPSIYQNLGDYYRFVGGHKEAVKYYTMGLDVAGDDGGGGAEAELYFSRAVSNDALGNDGDAASDLERAVGLEPGNPAMLNYYGYFLTTRDMDPAKGLKLTEMAVRLDPVNPYYLDSYGWAMFENGFVGDAVRMAEYAKAFEPTNPVVMDHLGDIYWRAGRRREAVFEWSKALRFLDGGWDGIDTPDAGRLADKIKYGLPDKVE